MKWIYKNNADTYDWYVFRNQFYTDFCENVFLYIASMGEYAVFVNGVDIGRGPTRSFNTCKLLDKRDISMFIKKGKNTVSIISLKLEKGGVAARITCNGTVICESDETWKMKKFNAIADNTWCNCPPLEPIRRCEEHFDSRIDGDVVGENCADGLWEQAQLAEFHDVRIEENAGEQASENLIMPKRVISLLSVKEREGFGFRLKNFKRAPNPVTKCNLDIFILSVLSDRDFDAECACDNGTFYINGNKADGKASFTKGENVIVVRNTFAEPEMFIFGNFNLEIKERNVCGFETNTNYFAWAYPYYSPVSDENVIGIINAALCAKTIEEVPKEILKKSVPCAVFENSTGFLTGLDRYSEFDGGFSDPGLKLNINGENGDLSVKNIANILTQNANYTTVSGADAGFILDFGEEQIGYITFSVCAKSGQIIEIEPFDLISDNGKNHNHLECMKYLCKDGWQTYISFYTKGFRYLSVRVSAKEQMQLRYFGVVSAKRAASCIGRFECDNFAVNAIYKMGVNTALGCMQDTYVDCPGFEQVYWAGDAKVTAHANIASIGDFDYDYQCLKILADSMTDEYIRQYHSGDERYKNGKFLTCPAFGNFCDGGLPSWSFMWLLQVYDNYLYSGNTEHMKALLPAVKRMISNCESMMSGRGLFAMEGAWNLIEWGENDLLPCGEVTASNIYLYRSYIVASLMTGDIGETENSRLYAGKAEQLKKAINKYCWSDEMNAYVDSVRDEYGYELYLKYFGENELKTVDYDTFVNYSRISEQTNAIACMYGVADGDRKDMAMKIVNNIKKDDYVHVDSSPGRNIAAAHRNIGNIVTVGSPFGLYYSFGALCENGDYSGVLDVMIRDYLYMLERGTTTAWEGFGKKGDKNWTRSVCHGWGASPAVYLITHILGIRPVEPGFKKFVFQPNLCGLKYIRATVPTPKGPIFVNIDKEKYISEIKAPDGCEMIDGRVRLQKK